jgi:hypothetical protein
MELPYFSSVATVYEPKLFLIGSLDVPTYSQLIIIVLDCVLLYRVDDYETAACVWRAELISSRKVYVSIGLYILSLITQMSFGQERSVLKVTGNEMQ